MGDYSFASRLSLEVQGASYLGEIKHNFEKEGFFTLDLASYEPSFSLLLAGDNSCSLWKMILKDHKMLSHMEDEVGIYDAAGLSSFVGYFVDALLLGPTVERSPEYFPVNSEANIVALKMNYTVGSMHMDGLLKFDLVQKDIDRSMLQFLKAAFSSDFAKQKTLTPKTPKPSDSFSFKPSVKGEFLSEIKASAEPVVEQVVEEEVVKAKKRKVGGVNIFPGKKR